MSIFDRFRRNRPQNIAGPETGRNVSLGDMAFGGWAAGELVTEDTALTVSAVYDAVRILSEDTATLPLHLYVREQGGRKRAVWRPEYRLMHVAPNGYQTAVSFRESLMASLLLWGNAYAEIERNGTGYVVGLHNIEPHRVQQKVYNGELLFTVDGSKTFTQRDIFHVHAFATNGLNGRSVIKLARDSIGLTKATESFGASYFGNGATPGGILKTQRAIRDPETIERLRTAWELNHKGPKRSGGVAVLDEGMEYQQIGIPPEDSQFLETRKFQVNDVARWFRIPPHMLGDLERATFTNIEHQGLEYVTHTLRPWLIRIEQEAARQLLPVELQGPYYYEHLVDGFLRGDIATRYAAYATGRQWGWLSANDIRRMENMNSIDGGDEYLVPMNMTGGGGDEK